MRHESGKTKNSSDKTSSNYYTSIKSTAIFHPETEREYYIAQVVGAIWQTVSGNIM